MRIRTAARRRAWALSIAAGTFSVSGASRASNILEVPDNGSEQMARGGAWVARASDPLATIFNPAGLAGQASRVTIQTGLIFEHTCFTRVKATSDTTLDPLVGPGGVYPRACNDVAPNINPQIGVTLRASDRLGIGLLLIGPSAVAETTFPNFVSDGSGDPQAAPGRFLLAKKSSLVVFPTVGVGYEILDNLRLGASFSWGFARLKLSNATVSLNSDSPTPESDIHTLVQVKDYFVPGFTLGGLYSATPEIDIAAFYKWSDAIRARGDLGTAANFYGRQNARGNESDVRYGDTIYEDCGTGLPTTACGGGQNATVKIVLPMEAKLGFRYHKLRGAAAASPRPHVRDPLATDVFDIEADLTWANNSAADTIEIRFPGDASGKGTLPVAGIAGGEVPPNADQKRGFKDVFGVRVGGDYNVVPDKLAVRGGGFIESSGRTPELQSIDFAPSSRFGLALGGTYRLRFGEGDKTSALEFMLGYSHIFFADQSRTDPNASGLSGIAGTSCNGSAPIAGTQKCDDGATRYRTKWPVNLGTITNSMNVINVGAAYRF